MGIRGGGGSGYKGRGAGIRGGEGMRGGGADIRRGGGETMTFNEVTNTIAHNCWTYCFIFH